MIFEDIAFGETPVLEARGDRLVWSSDGTLRGCRSSNDAAESCLRGESTTLVAAGEPIFEGRANFLDAIFAESNLFWIAEDKGSSNTKIGLHNEDGTNEADRGLAAFPTALTPVPTRDDLFYYWENDGILQGNLNQGARETRIVGASWKVVDGDVLGVTADKQHLFYFGYDGISNDPSTLGLYRTTHNNRSATKIAKPDPSIEGGYSDLLSAGNSIFVLRRTSDGFDVFRAPKNPGGDARMLSRIDTVEDGSLGGHALTRIGERPALLYAADAPSKIRVLFLDDESDDESRDALQCTDRRDGETIEKIIVAGEHLFWTTQSEESGRIHMLEFGESLEALLVSREALLVCP